MTVSKRSTTEAPDAPPRRRFGLPRLVDVRIRSKLGLILIVPLIALVAISGMRLVDSSSQAIEAGELTSLVHLNATATELAYALQTERKEAEIQAHKDDIDLQPSAEEPENFERASKVSQELQSVYESASQDLTDVQARLASDITFIKSKLEEVKKAREKVLTGDFAIRDLGPYTDTINRLRTLYTYAAASTTDMEISQSIRLSGYLLQASEYSEQIRIASLDVEYGKSFRGIFRDLVTFVPGRQQTMHEVTELATADVRSALFGHNGLGTEQSQFANLFEADAILAGPDASTSFKHYDLARAYDHRLEVSSKFSNTFNKGLITAAENARNDVVQQVLIEITVLLITLVLAVMFALIIARSMASSLRRLREGADQVAHVELPRAVAQIREAENIGQRTAEDILAELGDPLRMDNRDEIGTVATAFNDIHREAVRIAAEQAALRASVSQMFVNLARRSQNLVDRLIGHLDRLERGEEDPDRLAELFQLDHLATRMRRNDENLLVLAGADSTRIERNSAQIGDVLRAAQSEVEQYTRIEFGTILADSEVEPGAINDIVHLIAELLDNAASFSPPDSAVIAEARQVGDEINVRITDRGIGISPQQLAELNDQLSRPSDVDIAASRMMGLVVVARLAVRHDLKVTLQAAQSGRGTVAEVTLPGRLLTGGSSNFNASEEVEAPPRRQAIDSGMPAPSSPGGGSSLFDAFTPSADAGNNSYPANGSNDIPRRDTTSSQGMSFHPGDGDGGERDLPRRKVMEVTGEIIADGPADPGSVVLPMIRLDAAPLPGPAPEIPEPRKSSASGPPNWPASDSGAATAEPAARAGARVPAMDETMELPIFREVESAWFKASTPAPRPAADNDPVTEGNDSAFAGFEPANTMPASETVSSNTEDAEPAEPSRSRSRLGELPRRGTPAEETAPESDSTTLSTPEPAAWQTAADRGWREAESKTSQPVEETTEGGLPKRRPMERLVPGAVEQPEAEPSANVARRNPEGVRGLLSAYHRGVQRGRGNEVR